VREHLVPADLADLRGAVAALKQCSHGGEFRLQAGLETLGGELGMGHHDPFRTLFPGRRDHGHDLRPGQVPGRQHHPVVGDDADDLMQ
jgi:hypothetical protein